MSFLRRLFGRDRQGADVFQRLRQQVLSVTPDAIGLQPGARHPDVWAALMEWAIDDDVALLVAIADGTVSLYLSSGGGVIGAGQHAGPRMAAESFLQVAGGSRHHFTRLDAGSTPALPGPGRVRFHLRSFTGELTADAEEQSLAHGAHPLSGLFQSAQALITAIREGSPGDAHPLPAGPPPGTSMELEVAEPPDHAERAVARDPDGETIARVVRGLAWDPITFVTLRVDERNYMALSGSRDPTDGLSAMCVMDGDEHVSRRAPESLEAGIALLASYCEGDGAWRELMEWD